MIFTLAYVPWWRVSTQPVLVWVTEYMPMSTSTGTNTVTLELWSTSKVRVPYIEYSSTASTSTEYEYPTPGCRNVLCKQGPVSISDKTSYRETSQGLEGVRSGLNIYIALDFDRYVGSSTTEMPVIFQSDQAILNTNLVASKLCSASCLPFKAYYSALSVSRDVFFSFAVFIEKVWDFVILSFWVQSHGWHSGTYIALMSVMTQSWINAI